MRIKYTVLIVLVLLVVLGTYFRVFQVIVLAVAASVRKPWQTTFIITREAADGWDLTDLPTPTKIHGRGGVAITYHPEYHNFQPSHALRALHEAVSLGAEFIRVDIRWSAVLPNGQDPNIDAFKWYRSFLTNATAYGLKPIIVLTSPPEKIRHIPNKELLSFWKLYIRQVTYHFGEFSAIYQVGNEPNNPVYSIFDPETLPEAVIIAAQLIKKRRDALVLINYNIDMPHWRSDAEILLNKTRDSIDIIGIDHYPGTWAIGHDNGWKPTLDILSNIDTSSLGTPWFGRKIAIVETGFSTNFPKLRDEIQQEHFYNDLEQSLEYSNKINLKLLFVGIYELCDCNSKELLNPEAHFGLTTDNFDRRKKAFGVVQRISLMEKQK